MGRITDSELWEAGLSSMVIDMNARAAGGHKNYRNVQLTDAEKAQVAGLFKIKRENVGRYQASMGELHINGKRPS